MTVTEFVRVLECVARRYIHAARMLGPFDPTPTNQYPQKTTNQLPSCQCDISPLKNFHLCPIDTKLESKLPTQKFPYVCQ
jgi:hypothetical protein